MILLAHGRALLAGMLVIAILSQAGCNSVPGMGAADDNSGPADGSDSQPPSEQVLSDEALPEFSVVDVNAGSSRYQEAVSPRDYLGQISAWYFGAAT